MVSGKIEKPNNTLHEIKYPSQLLENVKETFSNGKFNKSIEANSMQVDIEKDIFNDIPMENTRFSPPIVTLKPSNDNSSFMNPFIVNNSISEVFIPLEGSRGIKTFIVNNSIPEKLIPLEVEETTVPSPLNQDISDDTDYSDDILTEDTTENGDFFKNETIPIPSNIDANMINPFVEKSRINNSISETIRPVTIKVDTKPSPLINILPDTTTSPDLISSKVQTEHAEVLATDTPSTSAPIKTFFVNSFTGTSGGSFLIMDPQIAFKLFNTNDATDVSKEHNNAPKEDVVKEVVDTVTTTESSFDYSMWRDVFIPKQFANNSISSLNDVSTDAITMEYDMNGINNEVDYEYNEDYIEQLPLYQDDASNLPILDSSNNLYRIEIDIPGPSIQQNKIVANLSQLLPSKLKEEPPKIKDGRISI